MENYNYWRDPRVQVVSPNIEFDERTMTLSRTIETAEGHEHELSVPAKFEVCSLCRGRGKVVDPNIDCNGLTREDFERDPDLAEDYFSGVYDIPCRRCRGLRVAPVPAEDQADPETLKIWREYEAADAEYEAVCRAELARGC